VTGHSVAAPTEVSAVTGHSAAAPTEVSAVTGHSVCSSTYRGLCCDRSLCSSIHRVASAVTGHSVAAPTEVSAVTGHSVAAPTEVFAVTGHSAAAPTEISAVTGHSVATPTEVSAVTGHSVTGHSVVASVLPLPSREGLLLSAVAEHIPGHYCIYVVYCNLIMCRLSSAMCVVFLRSVRRLLVTANVVPSSPILVILMKEALSSFETSVFARATRRNTPEDATLHSHRREHLKPYIALTGWTL
jgi:hypothetical protein